MVLTLTPNLSRITIFLVSSRLAPTAFNYRESKLTTDITLDSFPNLTASQMANAGLLIFAPTFAIIAGSEPNAIQHSIYKVEAKKGGNI